MTQVGRYSRVSRRIWNDDKVRRLSKPAPCAQFLFLRLLTGPELTCIPGLFQAWESGLAESLGWPLKGFREAFAELTANGLAYASWEHGLIWIPNAIKHNEPSNPNIVKSWGDAWAELPDCRLRDRAIASLRAWAGSRSQQFLDAFNNGSPNHSGNGSLDDSLNDLGNQEQEQDQEQEQKQEQEIIAAKPRTKAKPVSKIPITADWQPSPARVDAICEKHGVAADVILRFVPEFRLYWMPGGKGFVASKEYRRPCDWDQTFSNRIDSLVDYGRITVNTTQSPTGKPQTQGRYASELGLPGF